MKPCRITEATSAWLDWARAIAAFLVFAGHCRSLCFQPYAGASVSGKLLAPFYFVTGLGHQAVVVFFVLSGYLVGGSVLKELMETGTIHWGRYAVSRIVRIHSVLIAALLLGGLWDFLGVYWLQAGEIYSQGHFRYVLPWDVVPNLNSMTFLGNLACLHTIFVPVFGSNGPLWSLANEFWYYFLFPAVLLACWKGVSIHMRLVALAATGLLLWLLCGDKLPGFLIWLAGAGMRLCPARFATRGLVGVTAFLAALLIVKSSLLAKLGWSGGADYVVALGFCVWLLAITHRSEPASASLLKWGRSLANFSYTLYVCHFPMLIFLAATANTRWGLELPLPPTKLVTWGIYAAYIVTTFFICWALSLITEQQYHRLRNWLLLRLGWAN